MQIQFVHPHNSIREPVSYEALADFIVLTGPNGSGKSNLLQALTNGAMIADGLSPQTGGGTAVRLFALASLVAAAEGAQATSAYRGNWTQLQQNFDGWKMQFKQTSPAAPDEQVEAHLRQQLGISRILTEPAIGRLLSEAQRERLIDLTADDIRRYAPLIVGIRDPFSLTVGELFLTYHNRLEMNKYQQWRESQDSALEPLSLSDVEYSQRFGPPPWQTLNAVLDTVGLPYEFDSPPRGVEENLIYEAKLRHLASQDMVATTELSSGERTLLAVAMCLYTGSMQAEAVEMPQLLLLDEADASLHPSMIKSLLSVIEDVFVKQHKVRVIMTTHSPTTVALAPEDSLYIMARTSTPRLRKATSRDEALAELTVGLSTLSVRVENRRQVFVESEYDQECYQTLWAILRSNLTAELSLEFIASGRGGHGGCDAVIHLVSSMRASGNDLVTGLIDRDARTERPPGVVFSQERYSLENFLLDPLLLGLLLLRERIRTPEHFGLGSQVTHTSVPDGEWQRMADKIAASVLEASERVAGSSQMRV